MKFLSEGVRFCGMKAVVCAVLLVCVLIVVIAPQVDLPPTALRSVQRLIVALLIQLAALTLVFKVPVQANPLPLDLLSFRVMSSRPLLTRLSIICVRLC
jgi:hypothetical protein